MAAKTFRAVIHTALLALCAIALTGCMGGSSGAKASDAAADSSAAVTSTNPDVIRCGDILTIRLTGVPDGDVGVFEETVLDEGTISMPLLGSFKAAGKTLGKLKAEIEAAYRDRRIYATPNVTVTQAMRYINVLGEVRAPQRVTFTPDLTILKAISACGGFTDYAQKRQVRLSRGGKVYDFNAVEALADPSRDVPLQAGDQIQVLRTIF